ncbi:unnamed protein product [Tuber aestivum]|uniref:Major facilitator superfamily (MFS) profile domain-containing protein n=1 Tax=Tuber aestivum TaxID=59557 RepID=A0A292PX74_9PEZI|nr:unnamed protein product [Tuber aestivum]
MVDPNPKQTSESSLKRPTPPEDPIAESNLHSERTGEGSSRAPTSFEDPVGEREKLVFVDDPPDGGLTAWLQVLGVHITALLDLVRSYGSHPRCFQCCGQLQSYYVETLGASPAFFWIRCMQAFGLFFLAAFTACGPDARLFRYRYTVGTFLFLFGIFAAPLATTYWQLFLTQGVCVGIANGLLSCSMFGLVSSYFKEQRFLAVGLAYIGVASGGALLPVVVQRLQPRIGFEGAMRVVGLIAMATMLCPNLILKPRAAPRGADNTD